MTEQAAALWLQAALGVQSVAAVNLLQHFGSAAQTAAAGEQEWRLSGLLKSTQLQKLCNTPADAGERLLAELPRRGITLLTYGQPDYPKRLYELADAPIVLFVKGKLPDLDRHLGVGVVGTRKPGEYAANCTRSLCAQLAQKGVCVISGGALGIDSAAHVGALSANGVTVAVLGCGLDYPYLKENQPLRDTISRHGALISEYPPDTPPARYTFVQRNRIVAGLSAAVTVVQASEKSGSLITAKDAKNLHRSVFCVTGAMADPAFAGSHRWLAEGLAKPVFSADDILTHFPDYRPLVPQSIGEDCVTPTVTVTEQSFFLPALPRKVSDAAAAVYAAFTAPEQTQEQLLTASGLSIPKLLAALTELELIGAVTACGAHRYRVAQS